MSKPTCVFLGTQEAIDRAYSPRAKAQIASLADPVPVCFDAGNLSDAGAQTAALREAEYAFATWGTPALTEAQIGTLLPRVRALFYAAGSVQDFARPFLAQGVRIFSAWGVNAVPVAEVAVSQIVLACKGFFQTLHRGGEAAWPERTCGAPYPGAYRTSVGVLGAGQIGSMVIRQLRAMEMDVQVYDPFLTAERAASLGAQKTDDLPALFAACQVVSNHLADKPETRGLLDRRCFSAMRPNGVFLNTGRGRQVVEADLLAALRESPARAAVLDVTYPEPPEAGSALYTQPNVFLTPHMAGSMGQEVQRMGDAMAAEFDALLHGRETRCAVTLDMLRTMA